MIGGSVFCANCGERVSEGKAFCRHCGAPVGAALVDEAATQVAIPGSEAATAVQLPLEGDATLVNAPSAEEATLATGVVAGVGGSLPLVAEAHKIVPPPSTTGASAGAAAGPVPPASTTQARPAPASFATPFAAPPPPPPMGYAPVMPPAYPAYGQGQPPRNGRGGLIAGIVVAVVIVLAAAGVAAFFLLRDDGGTVVVSTTVQASTTTLAAQTTTTAPPASTTTTAASTTTTLATTTTVAATTTTIDPVQQYLTATDALVQLLVTDDAQIPVLAKEINASAPHVPQAVSDELEAMEHDLTTAVTGLSALQVPAAFQVSNVALDEAASWMDQRIIATIQGVSEMRQTGKTSAGTSYFKKGQQARDKYRAALQKFQGLVPID